MVLTTARSMLATLCCLALLPACGSLATHSATATRLTGVVVLDGPLAGARIRVVDAQGAQRNTIADAQGRYTLPAEGLQPPLMLLAVEAGNDNCSDSSRLWARCLGGLLAELQPGQPNVANVNALSDRVVSSVASALKLAGPQALLDKPSTAGITAGMISQHTDNARPAVLQALRDAGVPAAEAFDPVRTPMQTDGKGVDAVLRVLVHNRGYDNNSGEPGGVMILDADYRYVGNEEPLDLAYAQAALARAKDPAYTRVLIVGDSTASTYERFRLPRMGWGQVFEAQFKPEARVKVLNNAKSGRSSRNFYNQRYFLQMAQHLRPGDYVIIHHGHNDQNCDAAKPQRGAADVANLCTYPNDPQGRRQFPEGRPEMSFQNSLEVYVQAARARGAIPIIMTPTTRLWNKERKPGFPVVSNHFTYVGQGSGGYAFVGDYSQTVRDTARARDVPLIDIEAATIAFANAHQDDWKNYWLAADPARWPWYATQSAGTLSRPDTTHFQEAGARAVADMVASGIKAQPALRTLAEKLR